MPLLISRAAGTLPGLPVHRRARQIRSRMPPRFLKRAAILKPGLAGGYDHHE
jgi:hypothetical protein